MTAARPWLLAAALLAPAALVHPARAAERPSASAPAAHQGVAFAAPEDAKARIVDPDGKTVSMDGPSDLIAPSAVSASHAREAIARLIRTAAPGQARRRATTVPAPANRPAAGPQAAEGRESWSAASA